MEKGRIEPDLLFDESDKGRNLVSGNRALDPKPLEYQKVVSAKHWQLTNCPFHANPHNSLGGILAGTLLK